MQGTSLLNRHSNVHTLHDIESLLLRHTGKLDAQSPCLCIRQLGAPEYSAREGCVAGGPNGGVKSLFLFRSTACRLRVPSRRKYVLIELPHSCLHFVSPTTYHYGKHDVATALRIKSRHSRLGDPFLANAVNSSPRHMFSSPLPLFSNPTSVASSSVLLARVEAAPLRGAGWTSGVHRASPRLQSSGYVCNEGMLWALDD